MFKQTTKFIPFLSDFFFFLRFFCSLQFLLLFEFYGFESSLHFWFMEFYFSSFFFLCRWIALVFLSNILVPLSCSSALVSLFLPVYLWSLFRSERIWSGSLACGLTGGSSRVRDHVLVIQDVLRTRIFGLLYRLDSSLFFVFVFVFFFKDVHGTNNVCADSASNHRNTTIQRSLTQLQGLSSRWENIHYFCQDGH